MLSGGCLPPSHEIWEYLEAILRVLEPIFGREVLNTPPPQIRLSGSLVSSYSFQDEKKLFLGGL